MQHENPIMTHVKNTLVKLWLTKAHTQITMTNQIKPFSSIVTNDPQLKEGPILHRTLAIT